MSKSRNITSALGSLFCVLMATTSVAAAEAGSAGTAAPSAEKSDSSSIETVTVTAQRREELARNVPFSITTADKVQLEKAGVVNMMDLQRVVPGLVMTGDGAWSMPSMRGVTTTVSGPGNDSPVAIYVDGVYQPTELGGFFDLPDIDRVEVDKGPQGTLFGRNATGGAIQIFTAAPSFDPDFNLTATAGVFPGAGSSHVAEDEGLKGYFTGPIADNLAGSVSFHAEDTGGFLDDIVRNKAFGEVRDFGGRAKLLFDVNSTTTLALTAFYNNRHDDHAASAVALHGISIATLWPGSVVTDRPWQITADQTPHVNTQVWGLALRGDTETSVGTVTSLTSYNNTQVNADVNTYLAYSLSCLTANACIDFKLPNYYERSFSQEVYLASKQFGPWSFVSGANMYSSSGFQPGVINDFRTEAPFPSLLGTGPIFQFSAKIDTAAYAAYTQVNYDFNDRIHLTGGLRYSYEHKKGFGGYLCCDASVLPKFADQSWSNLLGRASIRYDLTDASNVYFTFSQGFKSGIVPYSDFSGSTAKPEKINSYEVGYKGGGENWQLNLAGFYYDYSDMQVQTFDRIVSQVTNAASSTIAGMDFDGTYQFSDAFDVHLSATWLPESKFDTYENAIGYNFPLTPYGLTQYTISMSGKSLIKTPAFTSSLTATYKTRVNSGDLTASLSLYGSSKFNNDIAGIMPTGAYATVGTLIAYRPDGGNFEYSLWGRNLTNDAHIVSAIPGASTPYVMYGNPLEVGVSVRYSH